MTAITLKSLADALRALASEVEAGRFGAMKPAKRRDRERAKPGALEAARLEAVQEYLAGRTEVTSGDILANVFHETMLSRSAASRVGWLMARVEGWRKVRTEDGYRYRRV
jgi:hypothetical protein